MEIGFGIDLVGLNLLIEKIDFLYDDEKKNFSKLSNCISELSQCYGGSSLDLIYSFVHAQNDNICKIDSVIESYIDLLKKLKDTYVLQNRVFSSDVESKIQELKNFD